MAVTARFLTQLITEASKESIKRFVVGGVIKRNIIGKGPLEGKTIEQILVLKRHINDFLPGIYELPSGRVDEGESLKGALFREIAEETGLVAKEILSYVNYFDYQSKSGAVTRQFNFLVRVVDKDDSVRLSEHDGYAWIREEEVNNYNITDKIKEVIAMVLDSYSSKGAGKRKESESLLEDKGSKKPRSEKQ